MGFQTPDMLPALPEMFVLGMASLILMVDLFLSDRSRGWTFSLCLLTLVGAALLTVNGSVSEAVYTFNGMFVQDPLSDVLKLVTYLITGIVFLYSRDYLTGRGLFRGEYFVLALFAMLGVMIMISAHHLISIYLGLELLSLCLYSLVAFDRDDGIASEAAMKYFVLGAIASGTLLYGMSILYGVTGSLDITEIADAVAGSDTADIGLQLGLAFVIVGLGFKLGAVPFHMWIPDVYQGARTSVTLFVATAPKLGAFALMMRLLVDGLGEMHGSWDDILWVMAALSMALGNIVAIAQRSMKRMLAYSTISHVGFILLGFLPGTSGGYSAALFYTITYVIMSAGAFGVATVLSSGGRDLDDLDDMKGLSGRHPWIALVMLILMASLAGVPPLVGFHAKWVVIAAALDAGAISLAVFAVLMSAIGLYYYLRIIWLMYFVEAEGEAPVVAELDARLTLSVNGLVVLALGVFPGGLMALCSRVIS